MNTISFENGQNVVFVADDYYLAKNGEVVIERNKKIIANVNWNKVLFVSKDKTEGLK